LIESKLNGAFQCLETRRFFFPDIGIFLTGLQDGRDFFITRSQTRWRTLRAGEETIKVPMHFSRLH